MKTGSKEAILTKQQVRRVWGDYLSQVSPRSVGGLHAAVENHFKKASSARSSFLHMLEQRSIKLTDSVYPYENFNKLVYGFISEGNLELYVHEGQQPGVNLEGITKRFFTNAIFPSPPFKCFNVVHDMVQLSSFPNAVLKSFPTPTGHRRLLSLLPTHVPPILNKFGVHLPIDKVNINERMKYVSDESTKIIATIRVALHYDEIRNNYLQFLNNLKAARAKSTKHHKKISMLEDMFMEALNLSVQNDESLATFLTRQEALLIKEVSGFSPRYVFLSEVYRTPEYQETVKRYFVSNEATVNFVSQYNDVVNDLKNEGLIQRQYSLRQLKGKNAESFFEVPLWGIKNNRLHKVYLDSSSAWPVVYFKRENSFIREGELLDDNIYLFPQAVLLGLIMLGSVPTGWEWGGGAYTRSVLRLWKKLHPGEPPILMFLNSWWRQGQGRINGKQVEMDCALLSPESAMILSSNEFLSLINPCHSNMISVSQNLASDTIESPLDSLVLGFRPKLDFEIG